MCTHLRLTSAQEYLEGNNSLVIPTDTIKNIVLVLAKKNGVFFIFKLALLFLMTSVGSVCYTNVLFSKCIKTVSPAVGTSDQH